MNDLNTNNIVPIPQKRNYLAHLLQAGYTPTLCLPNCKIPFYKEWQKTYLAEDKEEFLKLLNDNNFDFNFGIMTGVANFNNVVCIDFDTKQFTEPEQTKLIDLITSLLNTDYIKDLINCKKLYIEKSVNNGFHFVVSISDLTERKGIKLLDYNGTLKPNNLVKTEHNGIGEFIETRGHKQHFVTFPSNGYSRLHNTIWELNRLTTEEYTQLENFILDFFLNIDSIKFTKAGTTMEVNTSKKIRVPKTERNVSTVFDVVIEELKKFQSVFSKSEKDINIISDLLQNNGYGLIDSNDEYIYYIHPLSSKAESNLALSKMNHCITNFSGNNDQFPLTKSVGTLTAFYLLNGSKHSVNEIIEMLRTDYNVKLVRTVEEILQDANNKQNNN